MPLSPKERRTLSAAGNRLAAVTTIAAGELPDGVVAHVRQAFGERELVKVRVQADDRAACGDVGAQLAERVPCEVVARIGRVLLLYRAAPAE